MATTPKTTVLFSQVKLTKGAICFNEVKEDGTPVVADEDGKVVGVLYLRKTALNGRTPQKLRVTIEEI